MNTPNPWSRMSIPHGWACRTADRATLNIRPLTHKALSDQLTAIQQAAALLTAAGFGPVVVEVAPAGLGEAFADLLREQADPAVMQVR